MESEGHSSLPRTTWAHSNLHLLPFKCWITTLIILSLSLWCFLTTPSPIWATSKLEIFLPSFPVSPRSVISWNSDFNGEVWSTRCLIHSEAPVLQLFPKKKNHIFYLMPDYLVIAPIQSPSSLNDFKLFNVPHLILRHINPGGDHSTLKY